MLQVVEENIKLIKGQLKIAQNRQKIYADKCRSDLEFEVCDLVFLRVSPMKGVVRFEKHGKLNPSYVGPFEIVQRVRAVVHHLALPPNLVQIHNVFHFEKVSV